MALEEDVIRVQRIELVDSGGTTRGWMQAQDDGSAQLVFRNDIGEDRAATIGVGNPEGTPYVALMNRDTGGEVLINFTREGEASIHLKSADGSETDITP
jgi:hypothetical protein